MNTIITMYLTLIPAIFAGIFTMIWCKLPILPTLQKPLDGGRTLKDGKRLFGDNKTWKGLLGYVLTNITTAIIWGWVIGGNLFLIEHNFFYQNIDNSLRNNLLIGLLLGLAYAIFELPNSFLKRRLDIQPGKTSSSIWKYIFVFLDQADSVIGCVLVVWLFHNLGWSIFICYIFVGAFTHIIINILLYFMHLRKNMF